MDRTLELSGPHRYQHLSRVPSLPTVIHAFCSIVQIVWQCFDIRTLATGPGLPSLVFMTAEPLPKQAGPVALDTLMFDLSESTASYLIDAPRPTLVDVGSASTFNAVMTGLNARDIDHIDSIVLTHIHFDHAGGAGHLAERFPQATVYIHERVAKHLTDPGPLTEGVRSVWGEQTERLFGLPRPIPAERIQPISDGDLIDLGDRKLRAISTPGHTRAHLSFLDEGTGAAICGDALGIQIPGSAVMRPATPPADFSFPDAVNSIELLRDLHAASLHVAHFGPALTDPQTTCDRALEVLRKWHEAFLSEREYAENDEDLLRRFHCSLEASLEPVSPVVRRRLETVNPAWLNISGMTMEADRLARGRLAA